MIFYNEYFDELIVDYPEVPPYLLKNWYEKNNWIYIGYL